MTFKPDDLCMLNVATRRVLGTVQEIDETSKTRVAIVRVGDKTYRRAMPLIEQPTQEDLDNADVS